METARAPGGELPSRGDGVPKVCPVISVYTEVKELGASVGLCERTEQGRPRCGDFTASARR